MMTWFQTHGKSLAVLVPIVALVLVAYSCLPNVAQDYELNQLRVGMTRDEVVAILGRPDKVLVSKHFPGQETWHYAVWGGYGTIVFIDAQGRFDSWDNF